MQIEVALRKGGFGTGKAAIDGHTIFQTKGSSAIARSFPAPLVGPITALGQPDLGLQSGVLQRVLEGSESRRP